MELNLSFIGDFNVILSNDKAYLSQIELLYLETFTKGDAAQHFDLSSLRAYLNRTFVKGQALMCFDQNNLIACLLYAPLTIDAHCPNQILAKYTAMHCAYISELMVSKNYRGKGLGKKLMINFFDTVNKELYADAFIRVWDENLVALNLYKSFGFSVIDSIQQTKLQVDGVSSFSMTKLYLHKPL